MKAFQREFMVRFTVNEPATYKMRVSAGNKEEAIARAKEEVEAMGYDTVAEAAGEYGDGDIDDWRAEELS